MVGVRDPGLTLQKPTAEVTWVYGGKGGQVLKNEGPQDAGKGMWTINTVGQREPFWLLE